MKSTARVLVAAMLLCGIAQAQDEKAKIQEQIVKLGSDDPEERDRAQEELARIGRHYMQAIEEGHKATQSVVVRELLNSTLLEVRFGGRISRDRLELTLVSLQIEAGLLSVALDQVSEKGKIAIEFDVKDPDRLKVASQRFSRLSVRSVLDRLVQPLHLRWFVHTGRKVVVTDREHPPEDSSFGLYLHDVRALTRAAVDRPICGLAGPFSEGVEFVEEPSEANAPIGAEDLVELIRSTVHPDSWDEEDRDLYNGNGLLIARCTPDVNAAVARFLDTVATRYITRIRTRILFIGHRPGFLMKELATRPVELSAEIMEKIRTATAEGKEAVMLAGFDVAGFNAQVLSGSHGGERSYVRSYDTSTTNPVHALIDEGIRFKVKPMATANRRNVTFELRALLTRIRSMAEVKGELGPLQVPDVQISRVGLTQTVPVDRDVLITQLGSLTGFGEGIRQLMVVARFEIVE